MERNRQLLILLATALGVGILPVLVRNPFYLNVLNIVGLNGLMVVGLNLLIGYAGQISLGHAAFYGLGAYTSGILTASYGWSPWPAMGLAVGASSLVAYLVGVPTLRLRGHYLVMATLGFNVILNIVMVRWESMTGGPSGLASIPPLSIGEVRFDTDLKNYYLIWFFTMLSVAACVNLVDSRVGRALRAIHGSELAANTLGVNTAQYKSVVFVLSAAMASLAGSLYAHYIGFISPRSFDIFFSIELVTMVIVGGMGNLWGALFGAAFLTPLPQVLHFFEEYKDILYGGILVVMLMFLPRGIGGSLGSWYHARRLRKILAQPR
jgi:branched-chain amino acid transport system permease protein